MNVANVRERLGQSLRHGEKRFWYSTLLLWNSYSEPERYAKKTLANQLAQACYHMFERQEPFDVKRAFKLR